MLIHIVTPAPPGSTRGNRVTAERWGRLLTELGHRVAIAEDWTGRAGDLLVALHARKSFDAIRRWSVEAPNKPLVVAMTGTDLYRDLGRDEEVLDALRAATRIIVLQERGLEALPDTVRGKARVIVQSAQAVAHPDPPDSEVFDVCVLGHLRDVKDPFRAAEAARLLPERSRVRVLHVGGALEPAMAERARAEQENNPRYRWLGELSREDALRTLARSRLSALTSRMEGGANAIVEALAASVPIVASRIDGTLGLLGASYPGYFEPGDTEGLARLLDRAEVDAGFYAALRQNCATARRRVDPARERAAWGALLGEL